MVRSISNSLFSNKVPNRLIKNFKVKNANKQMELPAKVAIATVATLGLANGKISAQNEAVQKNDKSVASRLDDCHSDYWCGLTFP